MTPDKCKNCPALIYPYLYTVDSHMRKLPKEKWVATCSKNMALGDVRGMYARCLPDICEGANGRRYYFDYINETTKYE